MDPTLTWLCPPHFREVYNELVAAGLYPLLPHKSAAEDCYRATYLEVPTVHSYDPLTSLLRKVRDMSDEVGLPMRQNEYCPLCELEMSVEGQDIATEWIQLNVKNEVAFCRQRGMVMRVQ